jgi:hypothetical protein
MAGKAGVIRPNSWKSGPDPLVHRKYFPWLSARSQARYRSEEFLLSWEDWLALWPDHLWDKRGRKSDELALTRINHKGAWSIDNCHIVTRAQQLSESNLRRVYIKGRKNEPRSKTKEIT